MGLQVGSHQSRAEGQNHLPRPAGHTAFDAAQDTVGFLGCEHAFAAHIQPMSTSKSFLAGPLSIPSSPSLYWISSTHVQDLTLDLVEPHEVHVGPLLKLVWMPLDVILSVGHVSCTTQLGVICRLAEGAVDRNVYVIDEDIKQYWSQYGPLRDTIHHWCPLEQSDVDHYPLDTTVEPILHPLNS